MFVPESGSSITSASAGGRFENPSRAPLPTPTFPGLPDSFDCGLVPGELPEPLNSGKEKTPRAKFHLVFASWFLSEPLCGRWKACHASSKAALSRAEKGCGGRCVALSAEAGGKGDKGSSMGSDET